MSLQLGSALREGATQLLSRTGATLLGAYLALMGTILPLSNTMLVRVYERAGLSAVAEALPLTLDLSLSVAVASLLGGVGGIAAALLVLPAAGQLAIVLVQAPLSVHVLAVVAAAFNQLRGDAGEAPSESAPNADAPSTSV